MARMRSAAAVRGLDWLEAQVVAAEPPPNAASDTVGPRRASRRSRPPERLSPSPDSTPRARRRRGSPSRDPPASAVELPSGSDCRAGRNPARRPCPAATSTARVCPDPRPADPVAVTPAPSSMDVPVSGRASLTCEPAVVTRRAGGSRARSSRTVRRSAGDAVEAPLLPGLPAGPGVSGAAGPACSAPQIAASSGGRRRGRSCVTPGLASDRGVTLEACEETAGPSSGGGGLQPGRSASSWRSPASRGRRVSPSPSASEGEIYEEDEGVENAPSPMRLASAFPTGGADRPGSSTGRSVPDASSAGGGATAWCAGPGAL